MTDVLWPADLVPYKVAFYLQAHVGGTESPFSRQRKIYGLSAPRWVARFTFRGRYDSPYRGAEGFARRIDALLAEAEGTARFGLWDFRREDPYKPQMLPFGGTLTLLAAAKGATTMAVAGFSPGAVAFTPGDYVGGDGRAHIVTGRAEIIADAGGVAVVPFRPPLARAVAAGTPAVTRRVSSWFMLAPDATDDAAAAETEVGGLTEHVLSFVEDLSDA